ncbi:MAG: biotin/lipoyl-binding protein [candidate division KSB1 bacterium]|nr:biotin/lipoyl-binding protein [candidate division KSB1 bacterium]
MDVRAGWTYGWFLSVLLGLAAIGCGSDSENAAEATNSAAPAAVDAVPVTVTVVQTADVSDSIELTGTLRPLREAVIAAQVAGEVKAVYVDLGSEVKKDQPLVQIDPRTYELRLDQARATANSARAAYEKARADYERNLKLHRVGRCVRFCAGNRTGATGRGGGSLSGGERRRKKWRKSSSTTRC